MNISMAISLFFGDFMSYHHAKLLTVYYGQVATPHEKLSTPQLFRRIRRIPENLWNPQNWTNNNLLIYLRVFDGFFLGLGKNCQKFYLASG